MFELGKLKFNLNMNVFESRSAHLKVGTIGRECVFMGLFMCVNESVSSVKDKRTEINR